jgi:hypothetical protein
VSWSFLKWPGCEIGEDLLWNASEPREGGETLPQRSTLMQPQLHNLHNAVRKGCVDKVYDEADHGADDDEF